LRCWDGSRVRNLRVEYRFAAGDLDRTRDFAADLVRLAPEVIVANFAAAFDALQTETRIIPIVLMAGGDPIESGAVKNATHPEGNATGFCKRIRLARQQVAGAAQGDCPDRHASRAFIPQPEFNLSGSDRSGGAIVGDEIFYDLIQ
jgi:hypothetical protein